VTVVPALNLGQIDRTTLSRIALSTVSHSSLDNRRCATYSPLVRSAFLAEIVPLVSLGRTRVTRIAGRRSSPQHQASRSWLVRIISMFPAASHHV